MQVWADACLFCGWWKKSCGVQYICKCWLLVRACVNTGVPALDLREPLNIAIKGRKHTAWMPWGSWLTITSRNKLMNKCMRAWTVGACIVKSGLGTELADFKKKNRGEEKIRSEFTKSGHGLTRAAICIICHGVPRLAFCTYSAHMCVHGTAAKGLRERCSPSGTW